MFFLHLSVATPKQQQQHQNNIALVKDDYVTSWPEDNLISSLALFITIDNE